MDLLKDLRVAEVISNDGTLVTCSRSYIEHLVDRKIEESKPYEKYRAIMCGCGHRSCTDWHVSHVANIQSVHFTESQARAVAALLNAMET